jgi:hypothetical protein
MGTQKLWQSTMTTTLDASGVFSTLLGTPENPLPDAQAMDRPIFLGVSMDGQSEMRPLTTVTASAYALNVADNSITTNKIAAGAVTADKLNIDYVSAIAVDGVPITSKGDTLNLVSSDGLKFYYDPTTKQLTAGTPEKPVVLQNPCSNNIALDPTNTVINGCSNIIDPGSSPKTQYSTIAGGLNNEIAIGPGGSFASSYSIIAGGEQNWIQDDHDVIGGGLENYVSEEYSAIVGGQQDTVQAIQSFIGGGLKNAIGTINVEEYALKNAIVGGEGNKILPQKDTGSAKGTIEWSIIGGGLNNTIKANTGVVGGGELNLIDSAAEHSFIGGGRANIIQGPFCAIAGGDSNQINNIFADHNFIGGGLHNVENNPSYGAIVEGWDNLLDTDAWVSTIAGGGFDTIRSSRGFIGGGWRNVIQSSDLYSTIAGGEGNQIWNEHAFIGGGYNNLNHGPFGTLGGGNTDTSQSAYGFLGGGFHNTIDYNSDTAVLVGGADNYVRGYYAFLGGGLKDSLIWSPYAVLGGGDSNRINSSDHAFLGGGLQDTISDQSYNSVLVGGVHNHVASLSNSYSPGGGGVALFDNGESFLGGGSNNNIWSSVSVLVGGVDNLIKLNSAASFLGGGIDDTISNGLCALVGGSGNILQGPIGAIVGGYQNQILDPVSTKGFIGGGEQNILRVACWSAIAGGDSNRIFSLSPTLAPNFGFVGGGLHNYIDTAVQAVIGGGSHNYISPSGALAAIPGGDHLIAQSYAQFVTGRFNTPQGTSTPSSINGEDFLAIFGNGTLGAPSDAVEITIDGHTIVHDQLGSTPSGGRLPVFGGTYNDNTILAWGDIPAGTGPFPQNLNAPVRPNFGIQPVPTGIVEQSNGVYVITLQSKNPDGSTRTFTNASITITIVDNTPATVSAGNCGYATSSEIGVPGPNAFIVRTYPGGGGSCSPQGKPFFFKVCGR